jgi:hypothetical protein
MKILIISLILTIAAFAHGEKRDSWIYGPAYTEIIESLRQISIDYPEYTEFINYGKGEAGTELYGLMIKDKSAVTTRLSLITGAHHGNEYLNIADRLPGLIVKDLASGSKNFNLYFKTGGSILVTPIVNAWGYTKRTRANSAGQDLNRDYSLLNRPSTGFTHSEVKSLNLYVKRKLAEFNSPLVFTMDYHCCNGARGKGALIWTNNFDRESSRKIVYHKMRDIMKSNLKGLTAGTAMDIVGYDPKGTSNDYWDNYFGAYALVFEGQQGEENKKLNKHYKSLAEIFNLL